jgi:hypothetical protein
VALPTLKVRTLKRGVKPGSDVRRAQLLLRELRYLKPDHKVGTSYGWRTRSAVKKFKKAHHLKHDSVLGKDGWHALEKAYAKKAKKPVRPVLVDWKPPTARKSGPLGLTDPQKSASRARTLHALWLGANHRSVVHYTQGSLRWQWRWRRAAQGEYPNYADCSAYSTWGLHEGTLPYRLGDYVNGAGWSAGYTGTMVQHGVRISRPALVGDCVFYGGSYSVPAHVAEYIGNGLVISHGSEAGPLVVPWNYRPVNQVRRYIR